MVAGGLAHQNSETKADEAFSKC